MSSGIDPFSQRFIDSFEPFFVFHNRLLKRASFKFALDLDTRPGLSTVVKINPAGLVWIERHEFLGFYGFQIS